MHQIQQTTTGDGYSFHQLAMIRGALLQHLAASQITPQNLADYARRYARVTHWEELVCTAIDPDGERLVALVAIHRPRGYSGLFRRHGSIEYVRFFIDWRDGEGYQSECLAHFKACDMPPESELTRRPRYCRIATSFDSERYWGCVMNGIQPKVKAVLSWHRVPEMEPDFVPLFGNVVESDACIDTDRELLQLMRSHSQGRDAMFGAVGTDFPPGLQP